MNAGAGTERLHLLPAQWTRLPGTDVELYLHGRRPSHGDATFGVFLDRTGPQRAGGWNVQVVYGIAYARRVRP